VSLTFLARVCSLLILFSLCCITGFLFSACDDENGLGPECDYFRVVHGTVTDSWTASPLAGAIVTSADSCEYDGVMYEVVCNADTTDSAGHYRLMHGDTPIGMPPRGYLFFDAQGYSRPVLRADSVFTDIHVASAEVDVALVPER
jgi:hypothetical protein